MRPQPLTTFPQRSILFMRRLQNKTVRKESTNRHNYDEDTYLKAMKKFQREARGLVPGTNEYVMVRNKIYGELRRDQVKDHMGKTVEEQMVGVQQPNFSSFYCLLVVVPESTECYETLHVLKYFDFPVNVEEDNVLRPLVKKDMGFQKDDQYPLLLIDSSSEEMPQCELTTQHQILTYLQSVSLIGDHKTHSAWETQGLDFVDRKVGPVIEAIFRDLRPMWQFYMTPKHFKKGNITMEPGVFLRNYMWKVYKAFHFYITLPKITLEDETDLKGKSLKRARFQRFQEAMDTFVSRIVEDNHFHGGNRPDAVDFRVFAWIHRYYHTFTMKSLLLARGGKDDKLLVWFDRMDRITKNKQSL
ncbi:hypothetical protein FGO68_gene3438 [Halteria grandinella]|uniref:Uncharacterized protein n=1 Tax=Halteria grandinella TaxID=5974 RepID=A0A8J8T125_HALGN|nr:hypothetical protein FGO68_gene3438 [Halteria grandinella]